MFVSRVSDVDHGHIESKEFKCAIFFMQEIILEISNSILNDWKSSASIVSGLR